MNIDRTSPFPALRSRRVAVAALVAAVPAAAARPARGGRKRNACKHRNWCVDRAHTCGRGGGQGRCLVEAFGGNVCAEILFQANDCAAPTCADCVCILATGGGDRCDNGATGDEFVCARPL